jgi:hypothetical protein
MRTLDGKSLASGEFMQWIEDDRLHVKIHYDFGGGHWVEERSVIQQTPRLVQEKWSWIEVRDGLVQRKFEVDLLTGDASAEKLEKNEAHRWSKRVEVKPGSTFAGAAWALAAKSVRERLVRGEKIEFHTVGFTPQPRAATVVITHEGLDRIAMSGRSLEGDRFRLHPKVPWIAKPFVSAPDSMLWLLSTHPAAFLRSEAPLGEPSDSLVRVDLLPGEPSGKASPATQ